MQPIGAVPPGALESAVRAIREQFGSEASVSDALTPPAMAWDAKRGQHSSVYFLRELAGRQTGDESHVLGITECDLFIPALTFIFGQAQLGGKLALVSLARLRQSFYGLEDDTYLFLARTRKEVAHELGHTLGLTHCSDPACIMSLATTIFHVDQKGDAFCSACRRAIDRRIPKQGKR